MQQLLAGHRSPSSAIQFSDHVEGDGQALYDHATELGLEGIVSKRADAPYQTGRSKTWIKTKALQIGDFVDRRLHAVGGGRRPRRARARRMGRWRARISRQGRHRLRRARRWRDLLPGWSRCAATRPKLDGHAQGHHLGAAGDHGAHPLRQPHRRQFGAPRRVQGAARGRDLAPASAGRAQAADLGRRPRRHLGDQPDAAAVRQDPGRPSSTSRSTTRAVGDFMLPHIFGRPVSLVRSPSGQLDDSFFQRHPFTGMPPTVATLRDARIPRGENEILSRSRTPRAIWRWRSSGWSSSTPGARIAQALEKPDRIIFDLDPGRGHRLARDGRGGRAHPRRARRRWASCPSSRPPAARACTSWCR